MWYLDTGYITNRLENKYDADYTKDHALFMTCSQMYDQFRQANSVLNGLIRSEILSNDSTKRFSLYKSMPIMITKHLDAFLKRQKEEGLEKNDDIFLRDIINAIVTFYLETIVQFLKDAEILLILAYYNIDEQGRKNKWYFDDENFMIHLTVVVNIVEQIIMIDSKFRYLLGFDIKAKQEFGKTYEEKFAAQFKSFITNKELIMNGEEISDPSYYKIDELGEYPNLRLYYPNHQKINIAVTDKTTDKLLNLQAWVVNIPIKMESTIIACESLGYTRPSITKILSRQQSVDEASADKVVERLKSGVRFDSNMQRAASKPNFERQFTSPLGPLGEATMLGRLPSRLADNTLPETSEVSTSQQTESPSPNETSPNIALRREQSRRQTESPSPNETSPNIALRREQSRRQRGSADVKPPEEANREGENSATNPST